MRTTAAAVGVVGAALILAAIGLVVLLRQSMLADVRRSAERLAEDAAALLAAGTDPLELLPGTAVSEDDDTLVQVVDRTGRVVAASSSLAGVPPVAAIAPGESQTIAGTPVEDERFMIVAVGAEADNEPVTVLVGRAIDDVDDWTATAAAFLALGVPLLAAVVGVTTWRVVGRALGPVERMRREVEAISARELYRRVPQPASDDEIARLARTMNGMLDRLQQGVDKQRQFVSDAAHELRSPLAAIRQHAESAVAHPDQSTAVDLAKVVLDETLRLQRLVDDLLLLSRADEGELRGNHQVVDLDDVVLEVSAAMRLTTSQEIDTRSVSGGQVLGDARQLRQVVRNLLDNAIRQARGRVALIVEEHADGTTVLCVDDDGPGIPAGERDRVFERFVRLDEMRSRETGSSGLGLAIVAAIVAAHDGRIRIETSPLGGARIEIRFPTPR